MLLCLLANSCMSFLLFRLSGQCASSRCTEQWEQVAVYTVVASDTPGQDNEESQYTQDGVWCSWYRPADSLGS